MSSPIRVSLKKCWSYRVKNTADRVCDAATEEENETDVREVLPDLAEARYNNPAHRDVECCCEPWWERIDEDQFRDDPEESDRRNTGKEESPVTIFKDNERKRAVRPSNQHIDHGVVEPS